MIAVLGYIFIRKYDVFLAVIRKFFSIVSPFIYALVIAYCLNPLMKLFEKKFKLKRGLAIALTYFTILGLIVLGFIYVIPNIVESIVSISSEIPKYAEIAQVRINNALKNEELHNLIEGIGLLDYLSVLSSRFGTILMDLLEGFIASVFLVTTSLVKIVLGFLIAIYVLLDKERLIKGTKILIYMLLKQEKGLKLLEWIKIYHSMVGLYIGTKAIDSAIIGCIALIGLLIIGAPYAVLLALFVGVTNMVPYLGPMVGQIVGTLIGLFVSPIMAITILIFLFSVQQFDAWYLDPKLIGAKVGVRPFFILLALTIGGGYFGVIGMLLASPTIATIKIFYDDQVAARFGDG
jgi:predicted PurR-regulated permease PerM